MTAKIVPLILAGGAGSRLWPLSRSLHPKQFWSLQSELSLLQNTLCRSATDSNSDLTVLDPIIVCNYAHRLLVREQCEAMDISPMAVLLEPVARNTAPAIALVAAYLERENIQDAMILVLSSDHVIEGKGIYHAAIATAAELGSKGHLCTFGIAPTHPATGFGYIEQGELLVEGGYKIARFVEKPELRRAQQMIDQGGFSWNAGLFLFPKDVLVSELRSFAPKLMDGVGTALAKASEVDGGLLVDKECFATLKDDSIDYCLMENTQKGAVVAADFTWSDVGSWDAVWAISPKDALGNARLGDTFVSGVSNSLVRASGITLAVAGVDNLVVVGTKDAVLVVDKNNTQDVKKLVEQIKQSDQDHLTRHHDRQLASWGEVILLENPADGPSVHRLILYAGAVQESQCDMEHDILLTVISGTACVDMTGGHQVLTQGSSVLIPAGDKYALINESETSSVRLLQSTTRNTGSDDTQTRSQKAKLYKGHVVPIKSKSISKNSETRRR